MNKTEWYASLCAQLEALLDEPQRPLTVLANASALLYDALPDVNWAGFYLYDRSMRELYLGPFQGKPACMRIRRSCCRSSKKTPASVSLISILPDLPVLMKRMNMGCDHLLMC